MATRSAGPTFGSLAIHGGEPVRKEPMPPRLALIGDQDMQVLDGFLAHYRERRQDFGYQDTYERLYTEAFVRTLGVPGFADAVSTGTAALYVALAAMQLPPGSRVLVSPVTDPGTVSAIILNRLVPLLVDSAPGSPNAGVEEVEADALGWPEAGHQPLLAVGDGVLPARLLDLALPDQHPARLRPALKDDAVMTLLREQLRLAAPVRGLQPTAGPGPRHLKADELGPGRVALGLAPVADGGIEGPVGQRDGGQGDDRSTLHARSLPQTGTNSGRPAVA